jgi:hypothetical protein
MKAASQGHQSVIDYLLCNGANPDLLDAQGLSYRQILELNLQNRFAPTAVAPTDTKERESQKVNQSLSIKFGIICSQCQRETFAVMSVKNRILCLQCGKKNNLHHY